jgi:putative ABC transport system substrate-binding protein
MARDFETSSLRNKRGGGRHSPDSNLLRQLFYHENRGFCRSMKTILLLITATLVCLVPPAFAGSGVVVLQSSNLRAYEQARQGIERVLAGRIPSHGAKSIHQPDTGLFVLSEEADLRFLKFAIENQQPELLVAIGGKALAFATELKVSLPIVYLLVPSPEPIVKERRNVTGVAMAIPPGRQLESFRSVLPGTKRIGTIYNPEKSSKFIAEAQAGAAKLGIELYTEKARSSKQVPELLAGLRGRIDAFWILPELTVLTPQAMESILLFSVAGKIPVLSFSDKYLKAGAAVAVTFDLGAMGEKAGELAWNILKGGYAGGLPPVMPGKIKIEINRKVLDKLGRDYHPEAVATGSSEAKP